MESGSYTTEYSNQLESIHPTFLKHLAVDQSDQMEQNTEKINRGH